MRVSKFVKSYFDAWNHRDSAALADHLTEDGIYHDATESLKITHDELITNLGEFFGSNRQRYELIGDILTNKDSVAFQYRIIPIDENGVSHPADTYSGAEFMTLAGDAAITITDYYEIPGFRNAPKPSSPGHQVREQKYAKSGLGEQQLVEYKQRLESIMQAEKLYLRSDLTLPRLAEAVDCSVNHLSQVINAGFGVSFFDYLNRYRIAHARELLSNADEKSSAILNIAFTVGFNSNSAFYAAFKKCVGQTPAQYRRAQRKVASS